MIEQAKNGAAAVNRNVRAENPQQTMEQVTQAPTADVDVKALIKNDIDRVMATIQDPAFLNDNRNFEKLYNSLKNGLVPKYNDPVLVEQVLKEYFNI